MDIEVFLFRLIAGEAHAAYLTDKTLDLQVAAPNVPCQVVLGAEYLAAVSVRALELKSFHLLY